MTQKTSQKCHLLCCQMTLQHQFLLNLLDGELRHLVCCWNLIWQLSLLGFRTFWNLIWLNPWQRHSRWFTIYSLYTLITLIVKIERNLTKKNIWGLRKRNIDITKNISIYKIAMGMKNSQLLCSKIARTALGLLAISHFFKNSRNFGSLRTSVNFNESERLKFILSTL